MTDANKPTTGEIEAFFDAYVETALWSEMDNADESGGEPLDANYERQDIRLESIRRMRADCERFLAQDNVTNAIRQADVGGPDGSGPFGMAGHNFWLNRNGHGAGFWDGDYPEPWADILDRAAQQFGQCDIIVADDGKLDLL